MLSVSVIFEFRLYNYKSVVLRLLTHTVASACTDVHKPSNSSTINAKLNFLLTATESAVAFVMAVLEI